MNTEIAKNTVQVKPQDVNLTPLQLENFWRKVDKTTNKNGCWLWIGSATPRGYGNVRINSVSLASHRVSFEIRNGAFDKSLHVCHKCDNPPCVNPDHLFLGTAKTNMADMVKKNRHNFGEKSAKAKLNWAKVFQIHDRYSAGESQRSISKVFGVSQKTICRVICGRSWKISAMSHPLKNSLKKSLRP